MGIAAMHTHGYSCNVSMKNAAFNETCVKYHYILVGNLHPKCLVASYW